MSSSLQSHGLYLARLFCPWNSPGKNTGVGFHVLSRGFSWPRDQTRISCGSCIVGGFFTTEALRNPHLLTHCFTYSDGKAQVWIQKDLRTLALPISQSYSLQKTSKPVKQEDNCPPTPPSYLQLVCFPSAPVFNSRDTNSLILSVTRLLLSTCCDGRTAVGLKDTKSKA